MKSSPGLNSLQVVVLTLSANWALAVQEAAECGGGVARGGRHTDARFLSRSPTLLEPHGRLCVARRRWSVCVWPAHKHTHGHRTGVLRRVQHIRGDGRGKASEDQRVNWLLSPEAEAIRVFRVPRSQSPASPAPPAAGSLDKVNASITMLGFLERFRADARGSGASALSSA